MRASWIGVAALVALGAGSGIGSAQVGAVGWAELGGGTRPTALWRSADLRGRLVVAAPGDPNRLGFCAEDGIRLSADGGHSWSVVPTDGVAGLAAGSAYPLAPRLGRPVCDALALDPGEPTAVYASFRAIKAPQDAPPPSYEVGYATHDAGRAWQALPVPAGAAAERFGGFQSDADGVRALFGAGPGPNAAAAPPTVEVTTDGGRTWQAGTLGCPAGGPCVRWGQAPNQLGSCAMHGYAQPLFVSADGGSTWQAPGGARAANACGPNALVALSTGDVLLLTPGAEEVEGSAAAAAPVRLSRDGGATWVPLALSPLPGSGPRQIELLPDGRLLVLVQPQFELDWWLLAPGATAWCGVAPAALPAADAPLQTVGDRVWWLGEDGGPRSVGVGEIACAGSR